MCPEVIDERVLGYGRKVGWQAKSHLIRNQEVLLDLFCQSRHNHSCALLSKIPVTCMNISQRNTISECGHLFRTLWFVSMQ